MSENEELPSPSSGLFLEVSFRRLLASCEDIVAGTSLARPDLVDCWQRSPVFHHYVETLQEKLADLEAAAGSRLPRRTLEAYGRHVDALAGRLLQPDLPAYCSTAAAQPGTLLQQQPAAGAAGGTPGPSQALPRPPLVPPPVQVARTPPLPQAKPGAAAATGAAQQATAASQQPAAGAAAGQQAAQAAPSAPAEPASRSELLQPAAAAAGRGAGAGAAGGDRGGRLSTQRQLHEDLTDELAGLAAGLKSNTLAIERQLAKRGQLLDSTEAALDTSVQKTKDSKDKAAQIHRRGRANFCLTFLVMLIVGLVFAGMYLFIRMTRLAGYKAAVLVPMPPPGPGVPLPAPPLGDVPVYEEHYAEL